MIFFLSSNRFNSFYAKLLRGKNLEPNSWFNSVFGLLTPPEEGASTNIGQNFDETLQFEGLTVKNFFLFYYVHIFVKKKSWIGILCIFHECWEKKNQKHFAEKVIVCLKDLKGAPSNTLKLVLQHVFFSSSIIILEKCISYQIQISFLKNMHAINFF